MNTHCTSQQLLFQPCGSRKVVANFDAGRVSSDAGVLLLSELDARIGIIRRFAECFTDHRTQGSIEHPVVDLLCQRILALCAGYEDLNDHDTLRGDALFAAAVGKADVTGAQRVRERDKGHPLAGKSTLNRLELTGKCMSKNPRYKKIVARDADIESFFVEEFIDAHDEVPMARIVLDFDPSDIQLHGNQQDRFYHGYYGHHCYLPLYIFSGQHVLMARLRRSDIDGCCGTVDALEWLVPLLREKWPDVEIVVRGDSGFARDKIFAWCEANKLKYIIGLSRNPRLQKMISTDLAEVAARHSESGEPERQFVELEYSTQDSWSRPRRVVAKAEQLPGKSNPRFVVTNYDVTRFDGRTLYEDEYCARGEMENRIKEQQLDLFGNRASSSSLRGNQLRVWLSAVAHMLMVELCRTALVGTPLENAQTSTIRVRLLKVGALVRVSVRRVRVALSSVFPLQAIWRTALAQIQATWALPP